MCYWGSLWTPWMFLMEVNAFLLTLKSHFGKRSCIRCSPLVLSVGEQERTPSPTWRHELLWFWLSWYMNCWCEDLPFLGFAGPWPGSATCCKQFLSVLLAPALSSPSVQACPCWGWLGGFFFYKHWLVLPCHGCPPPPGQERPRLLPSPMDGHCLLHSVCSSWQSQLSYFRTIGSESIKSNIFIETLAKSENYPPFLSCHLSLSRGLRSYLIDRHYLQL